MKAWVGGGQGNGDPSLSRATVATVDAAELHQSPALAVFHCPAQGCSRTAPLRQGRKRRRTGSPMRDYGSPMRSLPAVWWTWASPKNSREAHVRKTGPAPPAPSAGATQERRSMSPATWASSKSRGAT